MRSVPEWQGANDDAPIPKRVRLRVFAKYEGVCQISKRKIRAGDDWDLDHEVALRDGGRHAESNLRPVLRDKHREKTAEEAAERAHVDRMRAKHLGIWPKSKAKIKSRGFQKTRPPVSTDLSGREQDERRTASSGRNTK